MAHDTTRALAAIGLTAGAVLILLLHRRLRRPLSHPVRTTARFHDSNDFDWAELAARVEPLVRPPPEALKEGACASVPPPRTDDQIARWQQHFLKHAEAPTPFFKERRSLLEEFPRLCAARLRVLEVGCGNGSSALSVLRGNVGAQVHATDPSPAAVAQTCEAIGVAGFGARLTTEVQRLPTVPCSARHGPFDVVMILFTLSAVPGDDDAALLVHASELLRPGGAVLVRDYGLYDMRHRKDARTARLLRARPVPEYLRPGGMHRRYYSLEHLGALGASAGLVVEESRYLCVRLRNEKRDLNMDRVYVHAVLAKPG